MRSFQTVTRFDHQIRTTHQAAYAQRSFAGLRRVLQAGQIGLANSRFAVGQVLGFQVFPETALTPRQEGGGLVEGVAETQSVVEVRQSGILVYSTTIPAGPFRLQGFPLLNTRTDLTVTLTGSSGQVRQFVVPAATLMGRVPLLSPGLSFGAGRSGRQDGKAPLLATAAYSWQLTPFTSLNAGILGSSPYRAGSVNLESQLFDQNRLSLQSTLAQDTNHGNNGTLLAATFYRSLSERFSININGRLQTSGYPELSDALRQSGTDNASNQNRQHYQWGGGLPGCRGILVSRGCAAPPLPITASITCVPAGAVSLTVSG